MNIFRVNISYEILGHTYRTKERKIRWLISASNLTQHIFNVRSWKIRCKEYELKLKVRTDCANCHFLPLQTWLCEPQTEPWIHVHHMATVTAGPRMIVTAELHLPREPQPRYPDVHFDMLFASTFRILLCLNNVFMFNTELWFPQENNIVSLQNTSP